MTRRISAKEKKAAIARHLEEDQETAGYDVTDVPLPAGWGGDDIALIAEAAPDPSTVVQTITQANGTVIEGPGAVAFRNSWLIHPRDVTRFERNENGLTVLVETANGNFELTAVEFAQLAESGSFGPCYDL